MKRMVTVVLLAFVASLFPLAISAPAEAGGKSYRCDRWRSHTYVGLESPVLHLRWGDLIVRGKACWRKSNGTVLHKKSSARMRVIPNGVSESWGTQWNTYRQGQVAGYYDGTHQNYQDGRVLMGTFRNCQGIGSARICGPTGHFAVFVIFTQKRLRDWEPGVHPKWEINRKPGEPYKAADDFDKKIRFYNSP